MTFSPDGTLLASGSDDRTVVLWDVATGQPLGDPLTGHTSAVRAVAFSSDGSMLASGSDDMAVRLWDVATGQPIGSLLTGHRLFVASLVFSPDGRWLASSAGPDITLWDVDANSWVARACRIANRNLSEQEWATYLSGLPFHDTCTLPPPVQ